MKHWDLMPGERVRLVRGADSPLTAAAHAGLPYTFRFRDTAHAGFDAPDGSLLLLDIREDGAFSDVDGHVWHVAGEDRHTRTVMQVPLGEGKRFTSMDKRWR